MCENLNSYIDKSKSYCLNEDSKYTHNGVLGVPSATAVLKSDADEQLLIHIHFKNTLKLVKLTINFPASLDPSSMPKTIKFFQNRENIDFDEASGLLNLLLIP